MATGTSINEGGVARPTLNGIKNGTSTQEGNQSIKEPPNAPKGSRCEIKSLAQKGDGEVQEKDVYLSSVKKPFTEYALVAKQVFNEKDKLEKTTVDINSPYLLSCLKEIVEYYPEEPLHFKEGVSFDSPFKLLNHHIEELTTWGEEAVEDEAKRHIKLLIDFLENEAGDKGLEVKRLKKAGLISFGLLWVIFKPGDLLYTQEYGYERLYRLQKTGYGDSCSSSGKFFELTCEYTSCDGTRVGTSTVNLKIWEKQEFVGISSSKIASLSIFPLSYLIDQDGLEERLIKRGKRYLQIRGVQIFNYDGLFMYLKTPPYDHYDERCNYDGIWLPRSATGRVVVDCKTFVEELRSQKEEFSGSADNTSSNGRETAACQCSEADPLLCPPFVYGFSLDMKEWCKFFVDSLKDIEWVDGAMDRLILPDAQRRLIRSLVTSHRFPDQARDEAQLKGKGLIFLLHGLPGSGKTLTAELVAEHTKRPLLKISTGELGSWGERISHELKRHLAYASIWHAIVLIDEADVFLEERQSGPGDRFEQNNLVAVFLRQLEYFQGILFLTSNRVQVFDRAIRSRIHLALQYHAPNLSRRRRLWEQQLSAISPDEIDIDIVSCLDLLAKPEMNGREISNAVNTARTLAVSEKGMLKIEHLDMVLQIWQDFQLSLDAIEQNDLNVEDRGE
ncbi:P-loop containing nucleoside triphosphate hydrolase protein [Lepidopterella palustris CBS 459.81]|uniref:P-loop containing nucleoside triphosphate hydrolase protein n=1 Tax=Lepidopterella palustris CBS 459.81 TaxID=1314670 RepID=A0A8E2JD08_9PEZI|nr:P-loop containing nucleoside triphosphate hydrolase protein [Lepidopterella palustris CBS 459.81]